MSLTRNQIIDLLTAITAYDRRTIGEGDIAAWTEAARRAAWTYPDALDAIHAHHAHNPRWIMPGHITEHIRLQRRQPAPARAVLALTQPAATAARRAHFMAQIRALTNRKTDTSPTGRNRNPHGERP